MDAYASAEGAIAQGRVLGGEPGEFAATAFRAVEKKYKLLQLPRRLARRQRHAPLPSTSAGDTVEDKASQDSGFDEIVDFHDAERNTPKNRAMIHRLLVADPQIWCYTFGGVPGLLVFSQVFSPEEQVFWCREAILNFGDAAQHPNILSTHAKCPRRTTCYQPPMRWSTLGFSYEWTSKTYRRNAYSGFPHRLKARIEGLIQLIAMVNQDQWQCRNPDLYQPQTAIVNYYPVGSAMMCHQDISEEVLDQPLVSLSFGCSAIFLMGTDSRDTAPHAFMLKSGDVAAFVGPARMAFHAVPRILDDCPEYLTLPPDALTPEERARYIGHTYHHHRIPDCSFSMVDKAAMTEEELERYWRLCMRHMRVNINVRQVYPDRCDLLFTQS